MSVDLSRAVGWWEEWQLRILVLGSLFLQLVLFAGSMVRLRIPMSRLCLWLAYLGADALAIYALATLFNRHKQPPGAGMSSSLLEVVWAPVLLIHLGGQHSMTAFSIEDNELWRRHIVTVASQVTVALYVFCKSWPSGGDKRLLQAAILLFVVGIAKLIQKPLTLKSASLGGVMTSPMIVYPERRETNARLLRLLCLPFQTVGQTEDAATMKLEEEHDLSLEEYVQEARELVRETRVPDKQEDRLPRDLDKLFVDISAPYSRRLSQLSSFLILRHQHMCQNMGTELRIAFGLIYTKWKCVISCPGLHLLFLLPFLALASFVLFALSHHKYEDENDIKVTFVLLCCTTLLEFLSCVPWVSICRKCCKGFFHSNFISGNFIFSSMVAQHNLVSFYARRSKPTHLMKFSALACCSGYINKHWYIDQAPESACIQITQLIAGHVKDGWKQYIVDAPSYKRFNNFRGQWTLSRHKLHGQQLWWSLQQVPFDWSVLIWHLATELCLHHPRTSAAVESLPAAQCSKLISNYMIYLLFIRPEMLMPGTRQGLFIAACYDIGLMLKRGNEPPPEDARTVAQQILRTSQSPLIGDIGIMVPGACKVAEELMELLEDKRWKVIQGVWVEMLCCSASNCRGYLHAKSMSEGVEFLTSVWLLLSHMGMETFADKFQRPEPGQGQGEEIAAGASASDPQDIV
ncbi:hypothetical protein GQ55_2G353900 [Panicum hallii var. hallii]|uniref:DUF4220 domain-containing protein n=1 Tax=Panicum hallii var. hallii TaxID=1504633 RepID=A0A2T7EVU2_9POAL|nr:hypothetical protein GQ55_2G353900 [Panicum hallii var. hallii]